MGIIGERVSRPCSFLESKRVELEIKMPNTNVASHLSPKVTIVLFRNSTTQIIFFNLKNICNFWLAFEVR